MGITNGSLARTCVATAPPRYVVVRIAPRTAVCGMAYSTAQSTSATPMGTSVDAGYANFVVKGSSAPAFRVSFNDALNNISRTGNAERTRPVQTAPRPGRVIAPPATAAEVSLIPCLLALRSQEHFQVLITAAVDVFHREPILFASRRHVDGIGGDVREVQQRDAADQAAEGEPRPVLGFWHVAALGQRPVAVRARLDQEDQCDDDVPLLRRDPADLVGRGPQLFSLSGEAALDLARPRLELLLRAVAAHQVPVAELERRNRLVEDRGDPLPERALFRQRLFGARAGDDLVQLLAQRVADEVSHHHLQPEERLRHLSPRSSRSNRIRRVRTSRFVPSGGR